ncbi:MAG: 50S ribosomal protein L9 [Armatimonadota bacterium]
MKVILTEEVIGLGEPGTEVNVAPGYARNYLVPRKLAVYVNSGKAKELEHNKRRLERKRMKLAVAAKSDADRINGQTLTIEARSGEGGKLFGSVTTVQIAEKIQELFELTVDRHKINPREPIRTLGTHEVDVRLMGDTRAVVTVEVVDPHRAPEAPAAEAVPVEPETAPVEPEAEAAEPAVEEPAAEETAEAEEEN